MLESQTGNRPGHPPAWGWVVGWNHPTPTPTLRSSLEASFAPAGLPGEFRGHQLRGTWSARHFSAWKPSRIYGLTQNSSSWHDAGPGRGHSLICLRLWVEMGSRKKDLSHDSPLASHSLAVLATAFSTLNLLGIVDTGDQPPGTLKEHAFLG